MRDRRWHEFRYDGTTRFDGPRNVSPVGAAVAGSLYYVLTGQSSGAEAPARETTPVGGGS